MLFLQGVIRNRVFIPKQARQVAQGAALPRVRMPFMQKVMFGLAIFFGALAGPVYITCNFKNYRGTKSE